MRPLRFLVIADDPHLDLRVGDIVTARPGDSDFPMTLHRVLPANYGALLSLLEERSLEPLNLSPDEAIESLRPSISSEPRVLPLRLSRERQA